MLPPSRLHQNQPRSHSKEGFESLISNPTLSSPAVLPFPLVLVTVPNHIGSWQSHTSMVNPSCTPRPPALPYSHQCFQVLEPILDLIFGSLLQNYPDSGWHPRAWACCLNVEFYCLWSPDSLTLLLRNNLNKISLWWIPPPHLFRQPRWLLWILYAILQEASDTPCFAFP